MNNTTDNFEAIAQDAVSLLVATALTLKLMGEVEFANAIGEQAEDFCLRAIALGGE